MNKFIDKDLENSKSYMEVALSNILSALDNQEIIDYNFGNYISWQTFKEILYSSGWAIKEPEYLVDWNIYSEWVSPTYLKFAILIPFKEGDAKIFKL